METITITFTDGSVVNFTDVTTTSYSNDGKVVKFKGKKDGDTAVANWEWNFSLIKSVKRV